MGKAAIKGNSWACFGLQPSDSAPIFCLLMRRGTRNYTGPPSVYVLCAGGSNGVELLSALHRTHLQLLAGLCFTRVPFLSIATWGRLFVCLVFHMKGILPLWENAAGKPGLCPCGSSERSMATQPLCLPGENLFPSFRSCLLFSVNLHCHLLVLKGVSR